MNDNNRAPFRSLDRRTTRRVFNAQVVRSLGGLSVLLSGPFAALAEGSSDLQPLAAQTRRLVAALAAVGDPLPAEAVGALAAAYVLRDEQAGVRAIEKVLDPRVLLNVQINPESRISVSRGIAKAQLVEQGWRTFLVKVSNQAGDTTGLSIYCPQSRPTGRSSVQSIVGVLDFTNGAVDVVEDRDRWVATETWDKSPMLKTLSGLSVEYRILQIYSRDRGKKEASLEADAGLGEQDLGYRSTLPILFDCLPSNDIPIHVRDEGGAPVTASLLITDALNRVYPVQGKRSLPDLWFERQIYRHDGETVRLSDGDYQIDYGRGPEYVRKQSTFSVRGGRATPIECLLERWVKPSDFGYYSGDTHIHAAGCAHYESPYEGVTPEIMFRQVQGEALDIGDVLTWAPGYYYQKQFFSGHVENAQSMAAHMEHHHAELSNPISVSGVTLRYDIEVSGFPSSHCGHLVLLQLAKQEYPGAKTLDDWPSWNLPILKWAKAQGAVVGYAHSAGGLTVDSTELPNYLMPRFDSSGANEYIADVTHDNAVDFISGCDLWPFAELNIWYHTLNCGFHVSFAGETDFPCITDERVGGGRSYVHLDEAPAGDNGYQRWVAGVKAGQSYVGDGRSHIFNLSATQGHNGLKGRTLEMPDAQTVHIEAIICARLQPEANDETKQIQKASPYDRPYWHIERSRIGSSNKVPVEIVMNGESVGRVEVEADGKPRPVAFDVAVKHSSWLALRILPSSHTNPIYITVAERPIRSSQRSAQWCRKAVDVCWEQKAQRIRPAELAEAKAAFDHARTTYDQIIIEATGHVGAIPPSTRPPIAKSTVKTE